MKLYLCYHCQTDKGVPGKPFTADAPKCPECGIDAAADKRVAHLIVQRRLVHFHTDHPVVAHLGSGELACGAKPAGCQVTRSISAATCPNCLASEAGKKAKKAEAATGDEFDMDGVIDLETQTLKVGG